MKKMMKRAVALSASMAAMVGLAACGGQNVSSDGEVKDLKIWDGYTQYDENSPLGKMYSKCADQVGVKLDRTVDQKQTDTLLQNATTGNLPDLTVLARLWRIRRQDLRRLPGVQFPGPVLRSRQAVRCRNRQGPD